MSDPSTKESTTTKTPMVYICGGKYSLIMRIDFMCYAITRLLLENNNLSVQNNTLIYYANFGWFWARGSIQYTHIIKTRTYESLHCAYLYKR